MDNTLTRPFRNLSAYTLERVASFLEEGGRPLRQFESVIARRAIALAGGDCDDAAAILWVASEGARR